MYVKLEMAGKLLGGNTEIGSQRSSAGVIPQFHSPLGIHVYLSEELSNISIYFPR